MMSLGHDDVFRCSNHQLVNGFKENCESFVLHEGSVNFFFT